MIRFPQQLKVNFIKAGINKSPQKESHDTDAISNKFVKESNLIHCRMNAITLAWEEQSKNKHFTPSLAIS